MGERGDVGRANGIVARGERGGTQVARRVDWSDLPPHIVRLGCATLVTLKFIFYQYLRFVRIVQRKPIFHFSLFTIPFGLDIHYSLRFRRT